MSPVSDIEVYQKLSAVADELDSIAAEGATLIGNAALTTAAMTVGDVPRNVEIGGGRRCPP